MREYHLPPTIDVDGSGRTDGTRESGFTKRTPRRSKDDRMVAGVCGGLARVFHVNAALIRLVLTIATVLGFGTGILIYLVCWILLPEE